jgi:hypothetical protein
MLTITPFENFRIFSIVCEEFRDVAFFFFLFVFSGD